jgi:hypothetical protein
MVENLAKGDRRQIYDSKGMGYSRSVHAAAAYSFAASSWLGPGQVPL